MVRHTITHFLDPNPDSQTGITATHRLPFELKAPTHAKFDKDEAIYHWTISSRTLRQLMEHFGPGIELLDVNTEDDGVVNFTCFTEKQVNLNNEGKRVVNSLLSATILMSRKLF